MRYHSEDSIYIGIRKRAESMENRARVVKYYGELSAVHFFADGTSENLGIISGREFNYRQLLNRLTKVFGIATASALLIHSASFHSLPLVIPSLGLVTDAGLNFWPWHILLTRSELTSST